MRRLLPSRPFSKACVFCRRISAGEFDRCDRDAVSFAPLNPVTPGHLLVLPRIHVADAAVNPEVTAATMRLAAEIAAGRGGDFNLLTSRGALATQTVGHLHVHLVPRREGDRLCLPWNCRRVCDEAGVS